MLINNLCYTKHLQNYPNSLSEIDFIQGDLPINNYIGIKHENECARKCDNDLRCTGFVWGTDNNQCYLKSGMLDHLNRKPNINRISYLKNLPPNYKLHSTDTNYTKYEFDYRFLKHNINTCSKLCSENDECIYFSLGPDNECVMRPVLENPDNSPAQKGIITFEKI